MKIKNILPDVTSKNVQNLINFNLADYDFERIKNYNQTQKEKTNILFKSLMGFLLILTVICLAYVSEIELPQYIITISNYMVFACLFILMLLTFLITYSKRINYIEINLDETQKLLTDLKNLNLTQEQETVCHDLKKYGFINNLIYEKINETLVKAKKTNLISTFCPNKTCI